MAKVKNIVKKANTKNRKSKKNVKTNKKILIFFLLVIIVAVIVYIINSPLFKIQHIIVTGNEKISTEEIIELSNINEGDNYFSVISKIVEVGLKNKNGYLKNVRIEKKLPRTIKINVEERNVSFQIEQSENYIYLDEQGYILEINENRTDAIMLKGFQFEEDVNYLNRLPQLELNKLETILNIQEKLIQLELGDKITYIEIIEGQYAVRIDEIQKTIYFGDESTLSSSNLNNKALYLKAILKQEEEKTGKVFLNGNLNDGFKPYFREE